jgi:hypothetical protein
LLAAGPPLTEVQQKGFNQIKDVVVPCLQQLLCDQAPEVRTAATQALVQVASVLRGDDVGKIVLTMVRRRALARFLR